MKVLVAIAEPEWFVSSGGTDTQFCGRNFLTACRTIEWVSSLLRVGDMNNTVVVGIDSNITISEVGCLFYLLPFINMQHITMPFIIIFLFGVYFYQLYISERIIFAVRKRSLGHGNVFALVCLSTGVSVWCRFLSDYLILGSFWGAGGLGV